MFAPAMQTDPTEIALGEERHPTLNELRTSAHPSIEQHLANCSMCRSALAADDELAEPIPLDLPKGLVSENAFKWPADPMARGGMAQIFAGEDRRLGRTVILKAPREGDDLPAGMGEMFQRRVTAEARILAKLQHPSIVKLYELGKASVGWPFCVLEKVDGISLRDRLDALAHAEAADGVLRTHERLELLSNLVSIAEALAYAHERRVVHRDCTPNNILLGKRGECTLIDWGIARDLEAPGGTMASLDPSLDQNEAAQSGVTISAGTPPYLPLEQTQGRHADPSFDVYSFGVTLYEVVSGRTPFAWKHVAAADQRQRQLVQFIEWLKSPAQAQPAMPKDPELSGIIARAMAKTPGERFTADELVRALKQYLTGDLVFSHRYSTTGRLARWARRNRAATVTMISILLFVVGGAVVWAQLSRQAKHTAELQVAATAARADASDKRRLAEQAMHDAEAAEALASQAKQQSKDADAMRRDAEQKRRLAEERRREFEAAAAHAKDDAEDAYKRYTEAQHDKEEAEHARDVANAERDAAHAAALSADRERDAAQAVAATARTAQSAAEKERDAARASVTAAEKDRDAAREAEAAARAAQAAAEKERDLAIAARISSEKDHDKPAAGSGASTKADKTDDKPKAEAKPDRHHRDPAPPPPAATDDESPAQAPVTHPSAAPSAAAAPISPPAGTPAAATQPPPTEP
jgi:tRNA A-37 threonylcarbamoyl transferase component Bud32